MLIEDFFKFNIKNLHHAILLVSQQFEQNFVPQEDFCKLAYIFCSINISNVTNSHSDLLVIDKEKKHINLDDLQKIKDFCLYPPQTAKRRLIYIERIERLNLNSANFLLKLLEEPRANTLFILTTSHKYLILPTILSRVQKINIHFRSLKSQNFIEIFNSEDSDFIKKIIFSFTNSIFFGKSLTDKKKFHVPPKQLLYLINKCETLAKQYSHEQLRSLILYWVSDRLKKDKTFVIIARFIVAHIRDWKRIETLNPSAQFWLLRIILGHNTHEII